MKNKSNKLNYDLKISVQIGRFDLVKYNVEQGADIRFNKYEPVLLAEERKHWDIFEYLISFLYEFELKEFFSFFDVYYDMDSIGKSELLHLKFLILKKLNEKKISKK
ncbi:hypothetical protein M0R19_03670 [Candidatus Pacearchaeota archaeon]|nr:hypothetical protein [Candidatus Pacearchaeota archaeon]